MKKTFKPLLSLVLCLILLFSLLNFTACSSDDDFEDYGKLTKVGEFNEPRIVGKDLNIVADRVDSHLVFYEIDGGFVKVNGTDLHQYIADKGFTALYVEGNIVVLEEKTVANPMYTTLNLNNMKIAEERYDSLYPINGWSVACAEKGDETIFLDCEDFYVSYDSNQYDFGLIWSEYYNGVAFYQVWSTGSDVNTDDDCSILVYKKNRTIKEFIDVRTKKVILVTCEIKRGTFSYDYKHEIYQGSNSQGETCVVKNNGEILIPFTNFGNVYPQAIYWDGETGYGIANNKEQHKSYLFHDGELVLSANEYMHFAGKDYLIMGDNKNYRLCDYKGNTLISNIDYFVNVSYTNYFILTQNTKAFMYEGLTKLFEVPVTTINCILLESGFFSVMTNELVGGHGYYYFDKAGKRIYVTENDSFINDYSINGYATYWLNGKLVLANERDKVLLTDMVYIRKLSENFYVYSGDGDMYGIIDINGNKTPLGQFASIKPFKEGWFRAITISGKTEIWVVTN